MATYDLTGTVKLVMDQQTFDSGFTKREFVVTVEDDRFPQDIKFECLRDKCSLLDGVQPGQNVTVTFDLQGREYNDRYFVNLSAWRIASADAQPESMPPQGAQIEGAPVNAAPPLDQVEEPSFEEDGEETDAMPF
jgi:single-strand DNA-binding protein